MKKIFYKISISKIVIIIVFTIIISFVFLNYQWTNNNNFWWMMSWNNQENTNIQNFQNTIFTNKLNIPEVLIPTAETWWIIKYSFEIKSWETEFFKWIKTKTLAYNWDFLGSTIRVKNWQKISFEIKNNLEQDTTVHWHWLHIPAEYDWWVFQVIKPGEIYKPKFEIKQTAWTFWYHPHLDWNTAFQAYKWLAWLFIIDDEISEKLDIPKSYWIDDIPLIIQDKYFDKNWQFVYANSMHT